MLLHEKAHNKILGFGVTITQKLTDRTLLCHVLLAHDEEREARCFVFETFTNLYTALEIVGLETHN